MWLGEQNQVETSDGSTTATDILLKYMEMKTGKNVITAFYDHQDIDMSIIAEREGIDLIKAQKSNTWGTGVLNTLFKNEMLEIDKVENWQILVRQIKTLRHVTQKNLSKNDDLVDSLRYACASVPWNFSGISAEEIINPKKREYTQEEINKDRRLAMALDDYEKDRIQTEIEEVNREFEV
jgi:hypothetical protein